MSVTLPDIGEDPWGEELNTFLVTLDGRVSLLETADPNGDASGVTAVNGNVGPIVNLTQDNIPDGTTNKQYPAADKTKLAGIASGATANSTDAQLRARSTHTGTQSADTLTDGSSKVAMTVAERIKLTGVQSGATTNSPDSDLRDRANHTGTQSADTIVDGTTNHVFTAADDTKLAAIPANATANSSDASLRDRNTHTGFQPQSSITNLATDLTAIKVSRYVVVWYNTTTNTWPNPGVDATIGVDWCSEKPNVPAPAAGGRPGYQPRDRIFIPKV